MTAHPVEMSQDDYCNDSRCERTRRGEIHSAHSLHDQGLETLKKLKTLLGLGSALTGGTPGAATGLLKALNKYTSRRIQ
jgi:hypothetical protein